MAIVKVNYVKRDKQQKHRAKASIRYMQHRPGTEGKRTRRILFGLDGSMERVEAYQMIDAAEKGSLFFRFIISPDPEREDKGAALDMRLLAMQTMQQLEETVHKQVNWVGAVHADHVPHRHVHLLAVVPQRLGTNELEQLRTAASAACGVQRQERAQGVSQPNDARQQGKEAGWHLPV
jgi:hypothetical protein